MPSDPAPDLAPYMEQARECIVADGIGGVRVNDNATRDRIARALHECAVRVRRETLNEAARIANAFITNDGHASYDLRRFIARLGESIAGSPPAAADPLAAVRSACDENGFTRAWAASYSDGESAVERSRGTLVGTLLRIRNLLDSDGKGMQP